MNFNLPGEKVSESFNLVDWIKLLIDRRVLKLSGFITHCLMTYTLLREFPPKLDNLLVIIPDHRVQQQQHPRTNEL